MDFLNILIAIVGIGLLIFVHEGGHFIAARLAGVRVEVFSLGFGPRLCGFQWRGTDFRLSLVPFGGYVMVAGAEPTDRRYPAKESLYAKSIGQRALFWSGGVIMNLLLALLIFPIVFGVGVDFSAPIIGRIGHGSAAWEAELQIGDRVLEVDGREIRSFENLGVEVALHGQRPIELTIERDGERQTVVAVPQFNRRSGLFELGVGASYHDFEATKVEAGGPAARAGIQDGDVLVRANGSTDAAEKVVEAEDTGEPLELEVRRGDDLVTATIRDPKRLDPLAAVVGITSLPRRVVGLRDSDWLRQLKLERGDVVLAVDGTTFLSGDLEPFEVGPPELRMRVARNGVEVELATAVTPEQRGQLADLVALGADESMRIRPVPDRPAMLAGIQSGDLVEAIGGDSVSTWDDMRERIEGSKGKPIEMRIRRIADAESTSAWFDAAERDLPRGQTLTVTVDPVRPDQFDYGFAMVAPIVQQEIRAEGFGDALYLGTVCSLDLIKQSYVTLKRLITGDVGANNLGGIIRITQVSYQAAQRGPSWFWYFLALISVNLAFVNLLPIPVLDGGHLLFLLIEKVKGSPVSAKVFGYSQIVGLVFVLLLVLFVTYNDILRLL